MLQSYPSVLPRASENRYAEADKPGRSAVGGCPVYDVDYDWARDTVVPLIASNLKAVAAQRGVQFMDLRDAFQGREICSRHTSPLVGGAVRDRQRVGPLPHRRDRGPRAISRRRSTRTPTARRRSAPA